METVVAARTQPLKRLQGRLMYPSPSSFVEPVQELPDDRSSSKAMQLQAASDWEAGPWKVAVMAAGK